LLLLPDSEGIVQILGRRRTGAIALFGDDMLPHLQRFFFMLPFLIVYE
jgi:hypothetical protein